MRATSWLLEAPDSLAEQMDGLDDLDPRAAASQRHATQRRETDASS
jgi:hypothetical protein